MFSLTLIFGSMVFGQSGHRITTLIHRSSIYLAWTKGTKADETLPTRDYRAAHGVERGQVQRSDQRCVTLFMVWSVGRVVDIAMQFRLKKTTEIKKEEEKKWKEEKCKRSDEQGGVQKREDKKKRRRRTKVRSHEITEDDKQRRERKREHQGQRELKKQTREEVHGGFGTEGIIGLNVIGLHCLLCPCPSTYCSHTFMFFPSQRVWAVSVNLSQACTLQLSSRTQSLNLSPP